MVPKCSLNSAPFGFHLCPWISDPGKTATCFPQLDVIKRLKHVYDDKIIYIHVEVYENPHLIKGNLQNAKISDVLNEWNIKSEPYTFLIKNKKLVSKFQGYVSYEEIDNDIDKILDVN